MLSSFTSIYNTLVLRQPLATLIALAVVIIYFLLYIPQFELDASADSLVLENDSFLIVTYSPEKELFSSEVLADIKRLREELTQLEQIDSVISLLDVPLVESPPMTLAEITRQVRTLESEDVNIEMAERELRASPLYRNLLVNSQGDTTAMQVNLVTNQTLRDLVDNRDKLYDKAKTIPDGDQRLAELSTLIKVENRAQKENIERTIAEVREVMDGHRSEATLYLGGVPMIASDSIQFIRSDLKIFGVGVVAFIVIILLVSFRNIRWVILPLAVCLTSALSMTGYLGWAQWPVTVVSSNFISLLLIITLSLKSRQTSFPCY